MTQYRSFTQAQNNLTARFKQYGEIVRTEKWQGIDISNKPDMTSYELLNETFTVPLFDIERIDHWQKDIKPNLPWADDHFLERVSGAPLNPGTQWENWPWASSADKHREGEMFNHTYMERLWPRYAGLISPTKTPEDFDRDFKDTAEAFKQANRRFRPHEGIRGEYGDLRTLVDKLAWEPQTRQAYIPLYFPEDTGAEGRMPCTLGYQFIMRKQGLNLYYPLRSCDFVRHWADDCYLAIRLLLWMIDECRKVNYEVWKDIGPSTYTMHCTSLHIFKNDAIKMGVIK